MKLFRMFFRSIRDAFKSVFRNFSLSLASISCIAITLVIVAVAIMASLNVNNFAKVIKEDVTIVVYVNHDVESSEIGTIKAKIEQLDNIATIEYKSKDQLKEEMQATSPALNEAMKNWSDSENPLKDTFLITVKDIEQIDETSKKIEEMKEIDFTDYGEKMVNKLISTFKIVEKVVVVTVIALIIVTVFLIINTIKLTIFSRKREISIMRLVGASNFMIKTPFIVEGMVLGMFGSIIPILIICFGYVALYDHTNGYLYSQMITLIEPEPFIYMISGIILVIGIIVGMVGSASAVRKYLKI